MERWLPVVGHPSYEVSDLGRVRSLNRYIQLRPSRRNPAGALKLCRGRVLKPGPASNGYLTVTVDGESIPVQHLVARAFIGPRPTGLLVLHGDGVKANNRPHNLRYGTHAENSADAARHGTLTRGSAFASAKLCEWTAGVVRALRGVWSQSDLAMLFDVSPAAIQAVHDERTWKHAHRITHETALDWFWAFGPAAMPREDRYAAN